VDTNHTATTLLEPIGCDGINIYYYRIVLTVTDPLGLSTTVESHLYPDCGSPDTPPAISDIPNQLVLQNNSTGPIAFTIGDAQVAAGNLQLSASSSNPTLTPPANIVFGGDGSNRTVTVTPASGQTGTSLITLTVNDGPFNVSDTFSVTVNPSITVTSSFTNLTAISIPSVGPGTPYPSIINASGLSGTISNVTFTFRNLTHTWGADVDMLLVGPSGQGVLLMADAGEGPVNNVTITLSDSAAAGLPSSGLVSGTFKPTDYPPADTFSAPAPAGPYATTLSAFNGQSASGTWSLYLLDDGPGDQGSMAGGWSLKITTVAPLGNAAPSVSNIPDQSTAVNTSTPAIPFTVGDADTALSNLVVTGSSSNPTLVPNANIVFGGSGANRTVTLTPATGQTGNSTITVNVSDGTSTASDTFVLTVNGINTAPVISDVVDQIMNEDTVLGPLPFIIGDGQTSAASLSVTASSSNPTLVPTSGILLGGSASNRTVRITPAANQSGTSIITLTLSDGALTASDSFLVTVNSVNDVPVVSSIADQNLVPGGSAGPVSFSIGDVETAAGSLTVQGSSSNPGLVPNANISFGGSGSNRTVTVTAANQTGSANITVSVSDGVASSSTTFLVTVSSNLAGTFSFTNAAAVTIPDSGAGTPYPSIMNVSGVGGTITNVTLTLRSISHTWPDDIDMLLVSPTGQKVAIFSDAGGGNRLNNVTVTLSDLAATALSDSGAIAAGTFKPADYEPGETFPAPAPAGPYASTLSAFNGQSANGAWGLYVFDDGPGDLGSIAGGWTLTIKTAGPTAAPPIISDVTNQTTLVNTPTPSIAFTIGDPDTQATSLTVTGGSSNTTLVPNANIVFGGSGSNRTVTVTPAASQTGSATITVTVSDGTLSASDTFVLTVNSVNTAPNISAIADQFTGEDAAVGPISFVVSDAETAAGSLVVTAGSSNLGLLPVANIALGGSGANRTVTLSPTLNQSGTSTVTLTVSDGQLTAQTSFVLTVTAVNDPPAISSIADQSVVAGASVGPLAFTVGDVETAAASLSVSGSSSNKGLIPDSAISFGGSGSNRTVTVSSGVNQNAFSIITISVSDGGQTTSTSFRVTVTATNTAPVISAIADQVIDEDTSLSAIPFSIGDTETAATSLVLSALSSNPTLLPVTNIVFSGSGSNRTVTVTPLPNQNGQATVTVRVSDGQLISSSAFLLTVNPVNDTPTLSDIPNQVTSANIAIGPIAFTIGDTDTPVGNLTLSGGSSDQALVPDGNIVFGGSGSNATITVTPAAGQTGSATITVTVNDGALSASDTFVLTVNSVNTAPTISLVADQVTSEDTAIGPISFVVSDGETAAGSLIVTAGSSNLALLPVANIALGGSGANRTVTLSPTLNQSGTATVTLTVSDGQLTAQTSFLLTVTAVNDPPAISSIADQSVVAGASVGPLAFTVGDVETAAASLSLSGSSSNKGLIPDSAISFGGSGSNRTVTVSSGVNQNAFSIITISVSDGGQTTSTSFRVTVTATNTPPVISAIADQVIDEDTSSTAIPFTIGDTETAATSLVLSALSSNPTLLPVTNIVFSGSGSSRTVTVTPPPNQNGQATVTIRVSDGQFISSSVFVLTVNPVNDEPTISIIANQTTSLGTAIGPISFTVGDMETAAGSLTVNGTSTNTILIPNANIVLGGSGSNRTVTITPSAGQSGTAGITLTVSDGALTASRAFLVTVTTGTIGSTSFTNATRITIPSVGNASPYPAPITVSGMAGLISNVTVTLRGFTHTWPADVDVLLVGPGGQKAMILSDVGGGNSLNNITVTLSDSAATALSATARIAAGTFRPTNVEPGEQGELDSFPAPAPAGPYTTPLSVFGGQQPNGTWSLFVVDDGAGDSGSFATGWSITITTTNAPGGGGTASFALVPSVPLTASLVNSVNGELELTVTAPSNRDYEVESSTDLRAWQSVGVWHNSNGTFTVNFRHDQPAGFYRVREVTGSSAK